MPSSLGSWEVPGKPWRGMNRLWKFCIVFADLGSFLKPGLPALRRVLLLLTGQGRVGLKFPVWLARYWGGQGTFPWWDLGNSKDEFWKGILACFCPPHSASFGLELVSFPTGEWKWGTSWPVDVLTLDHVKWETAIILSSALKKNWFTTLFHLCYITEWVSFTHRDILFKILYFIMVHSRRLDIVPWTIQWGLVFLSILDAIVYIYQPQIPTPSFFPSLGLAVSLFLFCR